MTTRKHAFTLLELLVTVAIVGFLAGILLPVGHHPASKFRRCWNNLRQIAFGSMMYAQDFNGRFPDLDYQPGNTGPAAFILLTKYVTNESRVFVCPYVAEQREKKRSWYQKRFVPQIDGSFFKFNGNDYAFYDGLPPNIVTNALAADRFAWTNRVLIPDNLLNHPFGDVTVAISDGHVEDPNAIKLSEPI